MNNKIMNYQGDATPQRGLPVFNKDASTVPATTTPTSVTLNYFNGAVLTSDAGEAAGTLVIASLAHGGIKNKLGTNEATVDDTSLAFGGTALTTEVELDWRLMEQLDRTSLKKRLDTIGKTLANGEYCVDYASGVVYGRKASTATALTGLTYKIRKAVTDTTVTVPPITVDAAKTGSEDGGVTTDYLKINASKEVVVEDNADIKLAVEAIEAKLNTTITTKDENSDDILAAIEAQVAASAITSGVQVVTTAGTQVALAATAPAVQVIVVANPSNTGNIYVGDSTVSSANGIILEAGDSLTIAIDDIAKVYIDSDVNLEGVRFAYTA